MMKYRFVFKIWEVGILMEEVWAQSHGYGCWDHHKSLRNVTHVEFEQIVEAKNILKSRGVLLGSFGYREAMGYLVNGLDGFVMQRRLWCSRDLYSQLEIYSNKRDIDKAQKNLEELAVFLKLPSPPKK